MSGRQTLLLVAIVLVGVAVAGPFVLGILTRAAVDDFVEMSNTTGDAELEVVEYEQGWFQSHMRVAVRFPEDEGSSIVFDHALRHGPLLPASECGNRFGFALSTGHSSLNPVTPEIEHFLPGGRMSDDCLFIDFNGNVHAIQQVAAFAGSDFDAEGNLQGASTQVAWAPISVDWTYLNETRPKLSGSLHVPSFSVSDTATHVQIDALTMRMDLRRAVLPELWDGEVVIATEKLQTWESDTQEPVSMHGFEMKMQAETGTVKAVFELSLAYESVAANEREFGEGRWSLRFQDLGTPGIQAFNERRESLLKAGIPQDSELYVQAFREFMPEILTTDPRVILDFTQAVENGLISAKGYARITKPEVTASDDPRDWLTAVELDLSISLPEWFLHDVLEGYQRSSLEASSEGKKLDPAILDLLLESQASAMLQGLEQAGYVQKREGAYRSRLYLRDGNATVNDQRIGNVVEMLLGGDSQPSPP